MARTLANYLSQMAHAIGVTATTADTRAPLIDAFNDAARFIVEFEAWPWRKATAYCTQSATVSVTNATYSEPSSVPTLTKTGGFSSYVFTVGDVLVVASGTGVTAGTYRIAGKTDSDSITLVDDLGTAGGTDISATVRPATIAPPTDFGELLSLSIDNTGSAALNYSCVRLVTPEDIAAMRQAGWSPVMGTFFVAAQPTRATSTSASVPIWPCYPTPTSALDPRLIAVYLTRWVDMATTAEDTDNPPVPRLFEEALLYACRARAVNLQNQDFTFENTALPDMLRRLARQQGNVQSDFGPMRGGVSDRAVRDFGPVLADVTFTA